MLGRYNAIDIEHALRTIPASPPFPPAADRAAWQAVRDADPARAAAIIARAEEDAGSPIPALPATLYLEFRRTGQREGHEQPRNRRWEMLGNLALAECLEYRGRFLDPLLDVAWAFCEESSWALPAVQHDLTDMAHPLIELTAAMTALQLAELDLLLGAELDAALGTRIRYEVERRCLTPYLARHDFWWLYNSHARTVNNWTAVCNAGVAGAALYLEPDPARLAEIVARAARSLDDYLATFDPDGGSSEGPGYWSYGFGYYTILAHLVEHRTGGQVDFLAGDHLREVAAYPLRTILSPGRYANFSDCDQNITYVPAQLHYLAQRLALPALATLAGGQPGPGRSDFAWRLRDLFWRPPSTPAGRFVPARHDWFSGMHWMIARADPGDPAALTLAAKGGHNGEMHNQNDVGAIIVQVNGESVIADPGRGRYTKAYFGPERYDHFVNASAGHSVPVPNGQAQLTGKEHGATVLEHRADDEADVLALELRGAYGPAADLQSLRRVVALRREARPWVELVDRAVFASGPGQLTSVLITFGEVESQAEALMMRGERGTLRVGFDAEMVVSQVEEVRDVDLASGPATIRRVLFTWRQPAREGEIRLRIEPV
jgi:hypothetical protein